MSDSFDLEAPDHFTCGAVGPPGQRVFYVQARESGTLVTLKCEKEQVRGLAEHLADILARLGPVGEDPPRDADLLEPIDARWVIGALGVGYDQEDDRIVIIAKEFVEEESAEPATARFKITRIRAAGFVAWARDLVSAGRPICVMCGRPKDPGGHVCPRSNGHVAR